MSIGPLPVLLMKFPALPGEVVIAVIDRVAVVDSGVEVPIGVPVNVTPFVSCVLFGVDAFSSAVSV